MTLTYIMKGLLFGKGRGKNPSINFNTNSKDVKTLYQ